MSKKQTNLEDRIIYGSFAAAILLFIAAYYVARGKSVQNMPVYTGILSVIIAAPSLYGLFKVKGKQIAGALLLALGGLPLIASAISVKTGYPFGHLQYTKIPGNLVANTVPWTFGLLYSSVFLFSYWLARQTSPPPPKEDKANLKYTLSIAVKGAFVTGLIALVTDTAAVRVNFWHWQGQTVGLFYKVPVFNLLGWLGVGFIATIILHQLYESSSSDKIKATPLPRSLAVSGLAFLWFWTSVNNWGNNVVPGIIGLVFTYLFGYFVFLRNSVTKSK